ncbi:hypothetical protein COMA2_190021 [Candidatus Nitrospira nitrificans]|uniref:Uncharacterized protein n=1 Tax=Candidatus Nitrospira nitrificans TaxID=1742973 RepID=A0A0S4LFR9_9BACT|nr:hypothetical protein COMA2_190021 [Candidatus Nitrospira nitrificans]
MRIALRGSVRRSECDAILGKKTANVSGGAAKESVEGFARREGREGSPPRENGQTKGPCSMGRNDNRHSVHGMVHRNEREICRPCAPSIAGDQDHHGRRSPAHR